MRDWGRTLVRSFGIANWFYGLTGAYLLADGLRRGKHFGPYPYEAQAYWFLVTLNALFLIAILIAGYWLIVIRRKGVVISNCVFTVELLFWLVDPFLSLALALYGNPTTVSIGASLAAVEGIGNMGTSLQLLTGYPVIALIALNLARRHMDRKHSWNGLQHSSA